MSAATSGEFAGTYYPASLRPGWRRSLQQLAALCQPPFRIVRQRNQVDRGQNLVVKKLFEHGAVIKLEAPFEVFGGPLKVSQGGQVDAQGRVGDRHFLFQIVAVHEALDGLDVAAL